MYIRVTVCTWYVHGMYIQVQRYKRVSSWCTSLRRVCTCIYICIRVLNHINMYIQCTNLYIKGLCCWCLVYRWLHTFHQMYRQCHGWTGYVHWYILLAAIWNLAKLRYRSHGLRYGLRYRSMDSYIRIPFYQSPQTSVSKHFLLDFDIEVHWLRYRSLLFHKTSILKCLDFDIEALLYWKYFDKLRYRSNLRYRITLRQRSNPISKITSISKLKFIYGYWSPVLRYRSVCDIEATLYRRLLRYRSRNSFTDIEVLYCDLYIEVSAISKQSYIKDYFDIEADIHLLIWKSCTSISKSCTSISKINIEAFIDSYGSCSCRFAESDWRLQFGSTPRRCPLFWWPASDTEFWLKTLLCDPMPAHPSKICSRRGPCRPQPLLVSGGYVPPLHVQHPLLQPLG